MVENDETDSAGALVEGTVLAGRYRVAKVVSVGANTVLIDAIDLDNDGEVTVKIVRSELARDEEFRRKFRHLAEISNALTHPNIASVVDWGEVEFDGESTVFWVVDALGGGSLRDLLDRGRLLEPGQALVVGLEACRALDAAHQKGLFHTELTPSKMVFGVDRRLRVVDFGMARLLAESSWADMSTVPTHVARYASPEQALGLPVDSRTDVYALALVLTEAVTGAVPFDADSTVATLASRVDKLLPVSADLGALAAVLERAGRPEAADRYSAAEFGRALVQAAPKLSKPAPIPIIATGLFDTTALRRPSDPTGGVERPAPAAGLAGVDEHGAVVPVPADAAADGGDAAAIDLDESAPDVDDATDTAAPPTDAALEPDVSDEPDLVASDETDLVASDEPATSSVDGEEPDPIGLEAAETETDTTAAAVAAGMAVAGGVAVAGAPGGGAGSVSRSSTDDADTEPSETIDEPAESAGDEPAGSPVDEPDESPDAATDGNEDGEPIDEPPLQTEPMPLTEIQAAEVAGEPTTGIDTVVDPGVAAGLYDEEAETSGRRKGPIIVMAVLLIAGLGALAYAGSLLLQTKSFEVPVLAGVPSDEALNQIAGNDWEITTTRERSDTFPRPDTVIRTDPGPGVELEEGAPFALVLSDGPEFRQLPELNELSFEAATAQLADLGLNAETASEPEFSETVATGSVLSWRVLGDSDGSMVAGSDILPGETIVLTLSKGPEPRVVPALEGLTIEEATAALTELQLELVQGDEVFSDDVPIGQIVSQSPPAEETLERDGTVTVQVSKGPDIVSFPDLEGLSFADAQTLLLSEGFRIGTLLGTTEGTFVEASIDGVPVDPGRELRRGTVVDLIFL